MKRSRNEILLDLLHGGPDGALATHSLAMPGFPFATAVPFAPDERHRPIFLISQLAEHTQNLQADARASLLLRRLLADGEMARVTLVGKVEPIAAEPLLVARYLRYQPEAERFLQLGDFGFHRLDPQQIRTIGGFAQAGWLAGDRLTGSAILPLAEEAEVLAELAGRMPAYGRVLGVDCYGIDWQRGAQRYRQEFAGVAADGDQVRSAAAKALAALGSG